MLTLRNIDLHPIVGEFWADIHVDMRGDGVAQLVGHAWNLGHGVTHAFDSTQARERVEKYIIKRGHDLESFYNRLIRLHTLGREEMAQKVIDSPRFTFEVTGGDS